MQCGIRQVCGDRRTVGSTTFISKLQYLSDCELIDIMLIVNLIYFASSELIVKVIVATHVAG